jgi:hypothetical protein
MFYFSYELDSKIETLGSEWRSVEIEMGIWSVLICERPLPYVDTCLHTREREEGSSYGIRVEGSELPSHAGLPETWGKGRRTDILFYILSRREIRNVASAQGITFYSVENRGLVDRLESVGSVCNHIEGWQSSGSGSRGFYEGCENWV